MHTKRPRLLSVLLVCAVSLAGMTFAAPANAAPAGGGAELVPSTAVAPHAGRLVEAQLALNCGELTGKARTYATEHNLCPTGPSLNTVVEGNCGKSWLFIVDDVAGDREGRMNYGVTSTQGPIVYRDLTVSWTLTQAGTGGTPASGIIPDSGAYLGTTYDVNLYTSGGPGLASAQLTGHVRLIWGGRCDVLWPYPKDAKRIT